MGFLQNSQVRPATDTRVRLSSLLVAYEVARALQASAVGISKLSPTVMSKLAELTVSGWQSSQSVTGSTREHLLPHVILTESHEGMVSLAAKGGRRLKKVITSEDPSHGAYSQMDM